MVDLVQSIGLVLLAAAQILAVRHSRWRGEPPEDRRRHAEQGDDEMCDVPGPARLIAEQHEFAPSMQFIDDCVHPGYGELCGLPDDHPIHGGESRG